MTFTHAEIESAFTRDLSDGCIAVPTTVIAGSRGETTFGVCAWNVSPKRLPVLHVFAIWQARGSEWERVSIDRLTVGLADAARRQGATRLVGAPNAELAAEFSLLGLRYHAVTFETEAADAHFAGLITARRVKLLKDQRLANALVGTDEAFAGLLRLIAAADLAGHLPEFPLAPPVSRGPAMLRSR